MRIGIDATCWSNPRGYGRYARGLITALLDKPESHEFILFVDNYTHANWSLPDCANRIVVETKDPPSLAATASSRRSVNDLIAMGSAVSSTPLDVFFYPSVYTYFPIKTRAKIALGIHDVIVEEYPKLIFPDSRQRLLWFLKSWVARWQADYIVTVSYHAKDGIMHRFDWPPELVWVVGEAPDPIFRPIEDRDQINYALDKIKLDPGTRFVICLGGLNPHKNLSMLFEVFAELRSAPKFSDLHLVMVGPAETDVFTPGVMEARRTVSQLSLDDAVRFTGFLPDNEVACILNAAQVLVLPSFNEGFGLGAVEAAACGTPVIATKNSPLPRLLNGGGIFIDPHKPGRLKGALVEVLSDEPKRNRLGSTALICSKSLTWERAADEFQELLTEIETKSG